MKSWFIIICCLISFQVFSQKKYEKESRISENEFPKSAAELLEVYTRDAKRLRFYRETDSSKISFEAKFKLEGKKYSVEFNSDSILEDVEIEISFRKLPEALKQKISSHLEDNSEKYSIKKVQKQYYHKKNASVTNTLASAFKNDDTDFINYEIVVWRSSEKDTGMVEFTFNKHGEFLLERPFSQPSYDHILY